MASTLKRVILANIPFLIGTSEQDFKPFYVTAQISFSTMRSHLFQLGPVTARNTCARVCAICHPSIPLPSISIIRTHSHIGFAQLTKGGSRGLNSLPPLKRWTGSCRSAGYEPADDGRLDLSRRCCLRHTFEAYICSYHPTCSWHYRGVRVSRSLSTSQWTKWTPLPNKHLRYWICGPPRSRNTSLQWVWYSCSTMVSSLTRTRYL